jgi:RNA polymerase sigma factor (sigma-70 family)
MLSHLGRTDSFTEFFSDVEPKLRRALTAALGAEVGREACAEALAYGWEHWDRLRLIDNPAGYLYRVGRGRGRRMRTSRRVSVAPVAVESASWFEPGLVDALQRLPEKQRVVVSLMHGYGWSMAEVAELLGVGKSTVQSYDDRAMKRLRRQMGVRV